MPNVNALAVLAGINPKNRNRASAPTNLHVLSGEVCSKSEDGVARILLDGLVFSENDSQWVEVDSLGGLEEGDIATILLSGEEGKGMTPFALGTVGGIDRLDVRISSIEADYVKAEVLEANYAHITDGVIDNATIGHANVDGLSANYAHVNNGVIDNATINHANVNNLNTAYAQINGANITNLTTTNGWIDKLMVQTGLIAHTGAVYTLDAIQVNASSITAGTLDVERLIVTVTDPQTGQQEKHLIHVDNEGTVSYEKLDGNVIQDNTITAGKIVAHSITTQEITTANLVGAGGWINLSAGTFQYVNAQSGNGISWDGTNLTIAGRVQVGGTFKPISEIAETVESTLIYDHTYEYHYDSNNKPDKAVFTAYLFRGGVDVKTEFDPDQFTWYYKKSDDTTRYPIGTGYTCEVNLSSMGYGGHVIGYFSSLDNSELLTSDDDNLTTSDDDNLLARTSSGDSVRVSDLSVATNLYPSDKIMIIGQEDEHLVSIQTLQGYLETNIPKQVLFGTTEQWNSQTSLVSQEDTIYVYTDRSVDIYGNRVAGIKVGDGNAYVVDLPFTDSVLAEQLNAHISNQDVHITSQERSKIASIDSTVSDINARINTKADNSTVVTLQSAVNTNTQSINRNANDISTLNGATQLITEKITIEPPYKEVEWVELVGHQFVATDYIPGANGDFGFDADFVMYNNAWNNGSWGTITQDRDANISYLGCVFGVRQTTSVTYFAPQYAQYLLSTCTQYGSGGTLMTGGGKCDAMMYKDQRRQQCSFHNGVYIAPDETEVEIEQASFGVPRAGIVIGGLYQNPNASGSLSAASVVRFYSLKFYDDEVLAADYIPCIRTQDSVPGFYDQVNDIFYPARGALYGSFTGNYYGEVESISEAFRHKNVVLSDFRTGNSRLIIVHMDREKHLEDGEQIDISLQYATVSQSSASLEIKHNYHTATTNTEVWLRIFYSDGSYDDYPVYYSIATRLTTHYGTGTILHATMVRNFVGNDYKSYVAKGFICDANYTVSNTNTVTDKHSNSVIAGKNGVNQYSLLMKDDEGNWTSLTLTGGTAATKQRYTGPLQFDKIVYSSANGRYEPGTATGDGTWNSYGSVDMRYSTNVVNNAANGLTHRLPVFIVGEVHNDGYFYLAEKWWTQTIPTEADGLTYIYLGQAYVNYYQIWLAGENVAYQFLDGAFVPVWIHKIQMTEIGLTNHINNGAIHITNAERLFWNDKVSCYLSDGTEELVFTTD